MKLKIQREIIRNEELKYGTVDPLEKIVGTYKGPEGKARVDVVRNTRTGEYYKLEISTGAPPLFYELVQAYFGVSASSPIPSPALIQPSSQPPQLQGGQSPPALSGRTVQAFPQPSQALLKLPEPK